MKYKMEMEMEMEMEIETKTETETDTKTRTILLPCNGPCGKSKPLEAFTICKRNKSRYERQHKCTECNKIYNKENKKYRNEAEVKRRRTEHGFINNLVCSARASAKHRKGKGREEAGIFDLTREDILDLKKKQNNLCAVLKVPLVWACGEKMYGSSIDRIDSNKGYTKDNIQLVCVPINYLKADLSNDKFKELIKLLKGEIKLPKPELKSRFDFTRKEKDKFRCLLCVMRRSSKDRGHNAPEFTLDDLENLRKNKFKDKCIFTGIPVSWMPNDLNTASWDRIDSNKGYTKDNIQLTIWPINNMKRQLSDDKVKELLELIKKNA